MKGWAVLVVLGLVALGAYALGYNRASVGVTTTSSSSAQPVAFSGPTAQVGEPTPVPRPANLPAPSAKTSPGDRPTGADTKRKVEVALTAAAIAAIIVQASRDQYHAGGRPCACPDDTMRNGRACGGRSAYSRPGGASPLCYLSDVPVAMIESYRQRTASREAVGR